MCKSPVKFKDRPTASTKPGRSRIGSHAGLAVAAVASAVVALLLLPPAASAGSTHGQRPLDRSWHGYGFLPGYEPPEVVEWRRAGARRPTFWYGGPGFYRGRWNGGGFGPCWTPSPIGLHWNCG